MSRLAPALLLALVLPAWAERPPGEVIESAVAVDVTSEGLNQFIPIVDDYVPSEFVIPELSDGSETSIDDCDDFDTCWAYSVTNGIADLELVDPTITPGNGAIAVEAVIRVSVNDATNPMALYAEGKQCVFGACPSLSQTCDFWVESFDVPLSTSLVLDFNPFSGQLSADILPIQYDLTDLTANTDKIHADDCAAGTIIDILGYIGLDVYSLILGQLTPVLDDQIDTIIDDLNDSLAPQLQGAVDMATVDTSFDVLGVPLSVVVEPEDVEITNDGVRILMAGSIDAPTSECVARYGIEGSLETSSSVDPIGVAPSGVPTPHVAVQADDDLVNQGLFAAWNGGLLCYTLDSSTEGLPLSIDTDILALMAPGVFEDLFPESADLVLQTSPSQPPTATLDGPNDIDVHLGGMGLDFYAEVDGRLTRLMQVELEADAGATVGFDPSSGSIDLAFDFDTSAIQAEVVFNELRPEANAQIEESLLGIVDTIAGPQIAGLLTPQTFALPAFEGYGLTSANIRPAAGAPDRLGVYGTVGTVSYTGGCEGGGCDGAGEGCSATSCDSTGAPGRIAIFAVPFLMAGLRRRRF